MSDTIHDERPAATGDDDWVDDGLDGDYVYVPKESGFLRKTLVALVAMAVFVVALLGAGGWWAINQVRGDEGEGTPIEVSIPQGATLAQASRILEEKDVIKNATFFRYYAKWKNINSVKAGDYQGFRTGMSLDEAVTRLEAGPLPAKFTELAVPEGYTVRDVEKKVLATFPEMTNGDLGAAEFAVGAGPSSKYYAFRPPGEISLEGFLFPATYRVEKPDVADENKLLDQMVKKFDSVADEVGLAQAGDKLNGVAGKRQLSPYDAMIVASLIEKEAKVPEDRAKIARVIYNRLERGMRLDIDAAVYYCFPGKTDGLTQSDLRSDCPYNTRQKYGLPPTPIANPGKASLQAALNPEPGDWLYYVLADKDGRHFFTNNYNEFLKQKQESEKQGLL